MPSGGRREGSGRKSNAATQKLREDLKSRTPAAMSAVDAVLNDSESPNHFLAARWLLDKLIPSPKPQTQPVHFEFDPSSTPSQQASAVMAATSSGELSPSAAAEILAAFASASKIIETDELMRRLELLEQAQGNK